MWLIGIKPGPGPEALGVAVGHLAGRGLAHCAGKLKGFAEFDPGISSQLFKEIEEIDWNWMIWMD